MKKCKCGSFAINPGFHGRGQEDLDLCDVCYWRKRAELAQEAFFILRDRPAGVELNDRHWAILREVWR